jgi:2,3-bisphosphoglycerate-dependent phosphoglycerate mutase
MTQLILVRHGESLWNAKGIWTGWTDIGLSDNGIEEARAAGRLLGNSKIDIAFTSSLIRAKQTLDEIKNVLELDDLYTVVNKALNERDYGELTGKNKWDLKRDFGDEKFLEIRRGWDIPIRGGETLKDVYNRVVPYFKRDILPKLKEGKNVLISAHGNSLRALVKFLENISDENISKLDIATGEVYIYMVDKNGQIFSKDIRSK